MLWTDNEHSEVFYKPKVTDRSYREWERLGEREFESVCERERNIMCVCERRRPFTSLLWTKKLSEVV